MLHRTAKFFSNLAPSGSGLEQAANPMRSFTTGTLSRRNTLMEQTGLSRKSILVVCALLGVSACGDTLGEQALLGGAAGAGTAVATGGDTATGAAVGAAGNVAYCQAYPERC